ncbi:MAG: hypothetical protein AAF602_14680, partial [Myxococcota bacterium]
MERWRVDFDGRPTNAKIVDDRVFVVRDMKHLQSRDLGTGQLQWETGPWPGVIFVPLGICEDVLVCINHRDVVGVDLRGELRFRHTNDRFGGVSIEGPFVSVLGDTLTDIDARTGEIVLQQPRPRGVSDNHRPMSMPLWLPHEDGVFRRHRPGVSFDHLEAEPDALMVVTRSHALVWAEANGHERWRSVGYVEFEDGDFVVTSAPTPDGDHVLQQLDAPGGRALWQRRTPHDIHAIGVTPVGILAGSRRGVAVYDA